MSLSHIRRIHSDVSLLDRLFGVSRIASAGTPFNFLSSRGGTTVSQLALASQLVS